jgi:CRP/FNR family transcriptional regulator
VDDARRTGRGDRDLSLAIACSYLRELAPETRSELLRGARRSEVPAAGTFRQAGERGPHLEIVLSGLVRVYLEAPDGRRLTVRYCRRGALLGAASLFQTGFLMPASLQALVDSVVVALDPRRVRRLASVDPSVAAALLNELSERTLSFVAQIDGTAFTSVRQRAARHLLDLASEAQHGTELRAAVSQQGLADAVGSVREVVVRVLRDFRVAGLIETRRGSIVISHAEGLLEMATVPE